MRGSFGCAISAGHSTNLRFRGGKGEARIRGHHRSSGRTLIWPLMSTGARCRREVFPPSKGVFRTAGDRDAPGYAAGFSTWRQHEAEALIKYVQPSYANAKVGTGSEWTLSWTSSMCPKVLLSRAVLTSMTNLAVRRFKTTNPPMA